MPALDFSAIFTEHYRWLLITGLAMTLLLFVLCWVGAMAVGILLTIVRMVPFRPLELLVWAYVEYQRNVPLLVHLFVWYFGIPQLLPYSANDFINSHNSELIFAVIAIALYQAAYISEDLRSGIRTLPKVQFEAARAMGFTFLGSLRWIILPQAMRNSLPPLVNQTLLLFKATSLAAVIGVAELTYQARLIENETYRIFESFSVITVAYLAGTMPLIWLGSRLSRNNASRTR
ncbi:polar amino acid ABC transporter, inner membrane subunit [Rhizobium sp. CF080]|uniref:amino acid ABC transporter permease n=1 Tax=Rhizobium sp. (strain CF080) TaxID=1144310 RepID=UPI00027178CC|nr:amino acid ABC transporter permease [Rhizobium sp. CF080]EUC00007.1 polar amino acid ABC transporter, inner membrane subunit [Rhizobium sp. CF080]